jgi:hypothetical protein
MWFRDVSCLCCSGEVLGDAVRYIGDGRKDRSRPDTCPKQCLGDAVR